MPGGLFGFRDEIDPPDHPQRPPPSSFQRPPAAAKGALFLFWETLSREKEKVWRGHDQQASDMTRHHDQHTYSRPIPSPAASSKKKTKKQHAVPCLSRVNYFMDIRSSVGRKKGKRIYGSEQSLIKASLGETLEVGICRRSP